MSLLCAGHPDWAPIQRLAPLMPQRPAFHASGPSPLTLDPTRLICQSPSPSLTDACPPGQGGKPCAVCPVGLWSAGGLVNCTACPANATTRAAGATAAANCTVCTAGYGGPGRCQPCGIGNFSTGGTSSSPQRACSVCAAGKTTLTSGNANCTGESNNRSHRTANLPDAT